MIRAPEPVALPEQPAVSPQLADLLTRLLDKHPATRIKLDEVRCCQCKLHSQGSKPGWLPSRAALQPGRVALRPSVRGWLSGNWHQAL